MDFQINYDLFIHYFLHEWKITKNIEDVHPKCFKSINFVISLTFVSNHFSYTFNIPFNFNSSPFRSIFLNEVNLNETIKNEIINKLEQFKFHTEDDIGLLSTNFNSLSLSDKNCIFNINSNSVRLSISNVEIMNNILFIIRECFYNYNILFCKYKVSQINDYDKYSESSSQILSETCNFGIV